MGISATHTHRGGNKDGGGDGVVGMRVGVGMGEMVGMGWWRGRGW